MRVAVFSVAMSPFDSTTRKRPLAVRSLANDPTWVVPERSELVICVKYASGVFCEVDCAEEESAPATSIHAAAALRKAITSLIIKIPNLELLCDPARWVRAKTFQKTRIS